MTRRECEAYIAALAPKEPVSPGIRRRAERSEGRSRERSEEEKAVEDANEVAGNASMPESMPERPLPEPATPGKVKPVGAGLYNVRFAAPDSFKAKLERLAEVLGVFAPERDLAEVLEKALDIALEAKDPERRNARRREREERRAARETAPEEPTPSMEAEEPAAPPKRSRAVPLAVRDEVLDRAGYRCEYRAPDGTRSTERTGLHIDHRDPFARGGATTRTNLRVLCAAHNRLEAEREFGRAFVAAKIDSRRRASASS